MIKRNPGTFVFIAALIGSFVLGLWQAMTSTPRPIVNLVIQEWVWACVYFITLYHARWIEGIMRRFKSRTGVSDRE
jgi:threonine/homoserine/homoserine lactone efflux protein